MQGDVHINVGLSRFGNQYEKAQYALDSAVMNSMIPFMPKQMGNFIQRTEMISASMAGTGIVCAAAPPSGRFLYEDVVMVDPETGSPWARKGVRKVVTDRALDYFRGENPDVTDHWFDAAKKEDLKDWVSLVKRVAGGGADG